MSTEISTHTQPRGLALQSVADAMKFGEMVASSDFAPKDFRGKPASCMLAIQAGAELGLAPLQSLQSIAVVNGRPSIYGDAALAVCKASAVCEYVIESIDGDGEQMVAICEAKRRGYPQPTVVRFSVADAKKAGLWAKAGPWSQYPRRMLQMRARGFALRDAFPDVLRGLVTAEEAQDYPTPEPAREPVVVRPAGHRPQIVTTPADVATMVTATPETIGTVLADKASQARLRINRAKTLDDLDAIVRRIDELAGEGVLTADEKDELRRLASGKAEMLIGVAEAAT